MLASFTRDQDRKRFDLPLLPKPETIAESPPATRSFINLPGSDASPSSSSSPVPPDDVAAYKPREAL